jgi:hypothetical protein
MWVAVVRGRPVRGDLRGYHCLRGSRLWSTDFGGFGRGEPAKLVPEKAGFSG